MKHIVLAITGASGVVYGQRLLENLLAHPFTVHLTISESGQQVIAHELGQSIDLDHFDLSLFLPNDKLPDDGANGQLVYHHYRDFMAPIASGSFSTDAMVICPCSGSTLAGVAHGLSQNLIHRAAEVHLKERRPLVLVPRETPLSLMQIENMRLACQAGATLMPASPGFYHGSQTVSELVDFVVARILDHLGIEHTLTQRWGQP